MSVRSTPDASTTASSMPAEAAEAYGGRVRVRVGALLVDDLASPTAILLAEHAGLWGEDSFWTPPGGGVDFGETLPEALTREVEEETGLAIEVGPLLYTLDFVRPPLHAVSFYFQVALADGHQLEDAALGSDPELGEDQLLRSLRLVELADLASLTVYPEPFRHRLAADAQAGFPDGLVHLGTFR